MTIIKPRKTESYVDHSKKIRMDAQAYVREEFGECLGVSADEITDKDEITNVQAHNLIKDARIYFNFRYFLHESTFSESEKNPFFTISQCINLIRFQLGSYDYKFVLSKTKVRIDVE